MHTISYLIFPLLLLTPTHDIQVAFFKLHQNESTILLDVTIETKDIIKELSIPEEEISSELLHKYLNENLEIQFDDEPAEVSINAFQSEDKHLSLTAQIVRSKKDYNSIRIFNTCLLSIEDQSNIIEIRLDGQERDFLMNNERTSININFNQ